MRRVLSELPTELITSYKAAYVMLLDQVKALVAPKIDSVYWREQRGFSVGQCNLRCWRYIC